MLPALNNSSNISLANGASSSEGTVVVDGNNYICDDDWDLAEAEVTPSFLLSILARWYAGCWAIPPPMRPPQEPGTAPQGQAASWQTASHAGETRATSRTAPSSLPSCVPLRKQPGSSAKVMGRGATQQAF